MGNRLKVSFEHRTNNGVKPIQGRELEKILMNAGEQKIGRADARVLMKLAAEDKDTWYERNGIFFRKVATPIFLQKQTD